MAAIAQDSFTVSPHPNPFFSRRITQALEARKRYKYVEPKVVPVTNGYRIESPCCSRKVDPEGGVIDVALLEFDTVSELWSLSAKVHGSAVWREVRKFQRFSDLLDYLNKDPKRQFWQ